MRYLLYCMFYLWRLLLIGLGEPGFCGLQMPGTPEQVRISLYPDDTTLVVTNENSISLTFSICREFGLASGAKLNMDKTCGMHSLRNLSMRGRAVICNVIATCKLTYIGQFLHLPKQFFKLINSELFSFIYGRQHERIKRETLYGDPSVVGLAWCVSS